MIVCFYQLIHFQMIMPFIHICAAFNKTYQCVPYSVTSIVHIDNKCAMYLT